MINKLYFHLVNLNLINLVHDMHHELYNKFKLISSKL